MYFIDAISYPFNSRSWAGKAFIVFLLSVIPLVNILGAIVLAGYTLRTVREILSGSSELPEFDFAEDLSKGFIVTITSIVYGLPFMFLYSRFETIETLRGTTTRLNLSGEMVLLLLIVGLIASLFLLIATVRYAVSDDFAVFVDVKGNFTYLRQHFGAVLGYGLNVLLFSLVGGILVLVGTIACVIPGLVMGTMLVFGRAYLLAQFAERIGLTMEKEKYKGVPRPSSGTDLSQYKRRAKSPSLLDDPES